MNRKTSKRPSAPKLILCDRCGAPAEINNAMGKIVCTNEQCAASIDMNKSRYKFPSANRMKRPI